jgi:hypothetical protein
MVNQVHKFKERDIARVVKAARASGVEVSSITVNPRTGEITVAAERACAEVGVSLLRPTKCSIFNCRKLGNAGRVPADHHPETVVLDFVQPAARRRAVAVPWWADRVR